MSATQNTPAFKVGDVVLFERRVSTVVAVSAKHPDIITVSNYAGAWMIGTNHSKLAAVAS